MTSNEEVKHILDTAYAESKEILQQHRAQLDRVAGELLQRETLDAKTFHDLISQSSTGHHVLELDPGMRPGS